MMPRLPLALFSFIALAIAISAIAQPSVVLGPEHAVADPAINTRETPARVHALVPLADGFVAFWAVGEDILAGRFSGAGAAVAPPMRITKREHSIHAAITPAGEILVAWQDHSNLDLVFLDRDLNAVRTSTINASVLSGIACNDTRCIVVTNGLSEMQPRQQNPRASAFAIDVSGQIIVPATVIGGAIQRLSLAATGSTFAVALETSSGSELIVLNNDLQVLNTRPLDKQCTISAARQSYVIACSDSESITLSTIEERGLELRTARTVVQAPPGHRIGTVDLASSASNHALVFGLIQRCVVITADEGFCPEAVYVQRFRHDLEAQDREPVAIAAIPQTNRVADIASNREDFLIAWNLVYGGPLPLAHLTPLPADQPPGVRAMLGAGPNRQMPAALVTSSTGSLVVWLETEVGFHKLMARRLRSDGAPFGPVIVLAEGTPKTPVAASDGQSYLVMWREGERYDDLRVKVTTIDAVTGEVRPRSDLNTQSWSPVLEWTGAAYVTIADVTGPFSSGARFLGSNGEESGGARLPPSPEYNTIASNGDRILISGPYGFVIANTARSVITTGRPFVQSSASMHAATWVGNEFLVLSQGERVMLTLISADGTIRGQRVLAGATNARGWIVPRAGGAIVLWTDGGSTYGVMYSSQTGAISRSFTVPFAASLAEPAANENEVLISYLRPEEPWRIFVRTLKVVTPSKRRAAGF